MTISTDDYALLAQDSYNKPDLDVPFDLGGVTYKPFYYADAPSGFQATAYERVDTHEIVIAFRGTEFGREPLKDGGTDAAMVLAGVNAQTPDAIAFTKHVLEEAQSRQRVSGTPVSITVTGHSLGGTLAEITASKYGLKGETFNAYGAAGLLQGVPEGGHQVIDHVRATDLVSAASPHFGEVRVYAAQQDIDTLTKAGYRDDSTLLSPRNPFKAIDFDAHAIDNFVPSSKLLGQSIINPGAEALYREHQQMIDRYRHDVLDLRTGLSASWEIPKAIADTGEAAGKAIADKAIEGWHAAERTTAHVAHEASEALQNAGRAVKHEVIRDVDAVERAATTAAHAAERAYEKASTAVKHEVVQGVHAVEHAAKAAMTGAEHALDNARKEVTHGVETAGKALHAAEQAVGEKASKVFDTLSHPGSWFDSKPAAEKPKLNDAAHPDHALFQQARGAVQQLDASHQRASDQRSDNLAAALTVAARQNGLNQVHHVVLSDDASRAYAVEGDLKSPFKRIAQVDTAQAMGTSIETSSATWEQQARDGQSLAQNAHAQQWQQSQQLSGPQQA
ncbi:Lipase (class 3) [Dyella jiangningensis]|uniref:XVIPCD domain-containing protein n=1 Tax=Dyella sp. AtDHG13 TaxID=1938897 RepID=UPI000891F710|nr:XVIPCD domain-containing protein [Dyella sp. AtDHG13]PXV59801.1 lipase (class 3) [Dyella sp. AtDHG13]SDJ22084.1 Lipase (class 3) [Dyella jiangningensis]